MRLIIESDAAAHGPRVGLGVVVRDESGVVLCSYSGLAEGCPSTATWLAEGMAILVGLARALDLGATSVEARTDALWLVEAVIGQREFEQQNETIVSDLRAALARLPYARLCWRSRTQNWDAHFLSRRAARAARHIARDGWQPGLIDWKDREKNKQIYCCKIIGLSMSGDHKLACGNRTIARPAVVAGERYAPCRCREPGYIALAKDEFVGCLEQPVRAL